MGYWLTESIRARGIIVKYIAIESVRIERVMLFKWKIQTLFVLKRGQ